MNKNKVKSVQSTVKTEYTENMMLSFNNMKKGGKVTDTKILIKSWSNEKGQTIYQFKKLHKNGVEVELFQTTDEVLETALTAKDQVCANCEDN